MSVTDEARKHAEHYVVGALLTDSSVLRKVQEVVAPDDFADLRLGEIVNGIAKLVAAGSQVDPIIVAGHLAEWHVNGIDLHDLYQMQNAVITAANADYYAEMVREAAVARLIVEVTTRAKEAIARGEEPVTVLSTLAEDTKAIRDRGATARDVRSLGEVLDVPVSVDAYDWTIPGLLERRDRVVLTGSEGGGKSTFVRQMAVCAAAGLHPFELTKIRPARVLVVDVENSERQWRRAVRSIAANARVQGVQDPRDGLWIEFASQMNILRSQDVGNVHRWIDQVNPDILVIGPLYKLAPSMKNDEEAQPILAALDTFRERGVSMLIEAHAGHAGANGIRDLRPIGSSMLLRWPEFGLGLAKPEKQGDPFRILRWRGDRDERNWPVRLTSQKLNVGQLWPWELHHTNPIDHAAYGNPGTPPDSLI